MTKILVNPKPIFSVFFAAALHLGGALPAAAQMDDDQEWEGTGALRVDALTMVPVGRARDLLGVGLGALVGADYSVLNEKLTLVVRGGYIGYLETQRTQETKATASDITLWIGAKWRLYKGLHAQGDVVAGWHRLTTITSTNEDKTQFNSAGPTGRANLGLGYEVGVFDFGALFSVGMEAPNSHLAALFTAGIRLPVF